MSDTVDRQMIEATYRRKSDEELIVLLTNNAAGLTAGASEPTSYLKTFVRERCGEIEANKTDAEALRGILLK
ncbi:hypothetical protein [Paraflavitalea pollutisoli]|uniref:hypothetical protein n=1 Tax=Paraflavitalea pollutisoli TaxID=3034143 RepID=UPI0023EA8F6C|nr:hypothetical protein [Paraflavitalea sp. H1-2-19X]